MARVSDDTYWITTALLTVAYTIAHQHAFQAMRVTQDGILKAWQGFAKRLSHIREAPEQQS